ncbi:MAG: hypothetical protein N2747_02830 [Chitinophagaceae bacterium]|nr:hypothetical protein [Chitinophagaceae bacterium]
MKYILLLFCSLALACQSQKQKATSNQKISGAWEVVRAEGGMESMNIGTVYDFSEKGRLTLSNALLKNPGTTEITDSTFSFHADGTDSTLKFIYNYRFKGDTMVVTMKDGIGQVLYLVKKK